MGESFIFTHLELARMGDFISFTHEEPEIYEHMTFTAS